MAWGRYRAANTIKPDRPRSGEVLEMKFKELIFSGVQPTGNLHLGNYLGAIKRFVELQDRFDCIYCVVDPKKNIVFNQSQVAEHAELAWIFNCVARLGWLNRMTQFKEKAGKDR